VTATLNAENSKTRRREFETPYSVTECSREKLRASVEIGFATLCFMPRETMVADWSQARKFASQLKAYTDRGYPHAVANTLNSIAFQGRTEARKSIGRKMILRPGGGRWVLSSVRVQKAKPFKHSSFAVLGSTMPELERQEFGGTERATGKGLAIATGESSGEGRAPVPRKRLPRVPWRMRNIALKRTGSKNQRGTGRRAAVKARIAEGAKSGKPFYLDLGQGRRGIFRAEGSNANARIIMLHDLSRKWVRIPPRPWLNPALDVVLPRMLPTYVRHLQKQLVRHRIDWKIR